jgi:hypothetical protein
MKEYRKLLSQKKDFNRAERLKVWPVKDFLQSRQLKNYGKPLKILPLMLI